MISENEKQELKRELVGRLKKEKEIRRIVIFGSFLSSSDPHDIDVAVFQDSSDPYLTLAMKYRKQTRDIARIISLDIIPVRNDASSGFLLDEIRQGETIYERRN
jgi:predicted nucleotidyltransferase